jgi:hypothetical protein
MSARHSLFSRANQRKVNSCGYRFVASAVRSVRQIAAGAASPTSMKTLRLPLALLLLGGSLYAQDAVPPPETAAASATSVKRTAEELDQLLAPIALYPDALIALILPASTVPTDIVLAARHLAENPGDRSQIEHRAWDESVKSLTNYPEVIKWMDENLHWTRQVGEAFAEQPAEVMQAVQRLRAKARAAGTLVDTPQQQILAEPQVIRIVPAQPDIIYVPHYEPEIVFVDRPVHYRSPFLTFGIGVPVGSWLAFDCDWRHNRIWVGNRHRRWSGHDWHRPVVPFNHGHSFTHTSAPRPWHPPQSSRVSVTYSSGHRYRSAIARPNPMPITTSRGHVHHGSGRPERHDGNSLPAASPLPHSFTANPPAEYPGPRAPLGTRTPSGARTSSVNAPPLNTPPAPMPNLQPLPQARQNPPNRGRDDDGRSRSFRGNQATTTPALPVVPPLPMATPTPAPQQSQRMGPTVQRSFSRANPVSAPTVVPSLPMSTPAHHPQSMGPTAPQQHRSFSRPAAPAVVPSLPMAIHSPAPVATVAPAPAAPAPTPAAAPAAQTPASRREGGGGNPGHRGNMGGRRDQN